MASPSDKQLNYIRNNESWCGYAIIPYDKLTAEQASAIIGWIEDARKLNTEMLRKKSQCAQFINSIV